MNFLRHRAAVVAASVSVACVVAAGETTAAPIQLRPDWSVVGDREQGQLGAEVAGAGDVNGDGFADVIVGAFSQTFGFHQQGAAYVFLGSARGLATTPVWATIGDAANQHRGRAVRTAGDVDGDGYAEIIVGAPSFSNVSTLGPVATAHVFRGGAGGPSAAESWRVTSTQLGDRLGRAVGTAGDVNGDGFDDVIVGAYFHDVGGFTDNGGLAVYHGGASGLSRHHDWIMALPAPGAGLGWGVAAAGDVNGDGFGDVVAGAPKFDTQRNGIVSLDGKALVWHGSADGLATTPAWTATIPDRGSDFGRNVSSAGDVNGDGYDDVIIGARLADDTTAGVPKSGAAYLYLGSSAGLRTTPAWVAHGENPLAHFGIYAAGAGDLDGDGFDDVVVGAPGAERGRPAQGAIYVYRGSAAGLSPTADFVAESGQDQAGLGFSAWTAGDVDGDGLADIIAGAPFFDTAFEDAGAAHVYLGASIRAALATAVDAPGTASLLAAAGLLLAASSRRLRFAGCAAGGTAAQRARRRQAP